MQRFFVEEVKTEFVVLKDLDRRHIVKVLRMKPGQEVLVCDGRLNDFVCVIEKIYRDEVILKVLSKQKNSNEPNVNVYLYQAIPKFSKLEYIIQKSVELGVKGIIPIITGRSVSNIKSENIEKKLERFRKIARHAAQQSGRGELPFIGNVLTFEEAIKDLLKADLKILFYEYGKVELNKIDVCDKKNISFVVGSEGGFEEKEVLFAEKNGVLIGSLGKRILRCETAPICALSIFMYVTGNL